MATPQMEGVLLGGADLRRSQPVKETRLVGAMLAVSTKTQMGRNPAAGRNPSARAVKARS